MFFFWSAHHCELDVLVTPETLKLLYPELVLISFETQILITAVLRTYGVLHLVGPLNISAEA